MIPNGRQTYSFHNKRKREKKNESEPLTSKPESTEARDKARGGTRLSKAELKLIKCFRHPQDRGGQLGHWLRPGDASLETSIMPVSGHELVK